MEYNKQSNTDEVINELDKIITSVKDYKTNYNYDEISLLEVCRLLRNKYIEHSELNKNLREEINLTLSNPCYRYKTPCGIKPYCDCVGFDPTSQTFIIVISDTSSHTYCFKKEDNDIYISDKPLNCGSSAEYLKLIGNIILKYFDLYTERRDIYLQKTKTNVPTNIEWYIDIDLHSVSIHNKRESFKIEDEFELEYKVVLDNYNYKCNSNKILNYINGREEEIFKNTIIKIDNCPEWMRVALYKIRKEQIEKNKEIMEEQKDQKRLSLKNKLFP